MQSEKSPYSSSNQYDLFSCQFKEDPFPTFADLRQHDPIYPHIAPDGSTIWYISRYDDVIEVLKDNETYGPFLVPVERLWQAANTRDSATGKSRGLLVVAVQP